MKQIRLPIADPCHESWDAMSPTDRGRFCQQCTKQVYEISALTERETRTLLTDKAGERICVRYKCDTKGNIKFRPERPVAAAMLAVALAACTPHENSRVERGQPVDRIEATQTDNDGEMMGKLEVVDPPPVQEIEVMGEAPIEEVEPVEELMGDVAAPVEPEGEKEPCDKPPEVEEEKDDERIHVRMGKPMPMPRPEPPPTDPKPEADADPTEPRGASDEKEIMGWL